MLRTKISSKRAESLLFPIAAFLLAGGMNRRAAQKSFSLAIEKAQNAQGRRRIDHIGHPTRYADIVARWAHDKRFLDPKGRPRKLLMEGRNGLAELIHTVGRGLNAPLVVKVLTRYGNVRKTREGRYVLITPFFSTSTGKSVAFEPAAYFLADASSTLSRILKRTSHSRWPELFWRKVESTGLSETNAKNFTAYVTDRSLEFLQELDDWLESRKPARPSKQLSRKVRRVGLGLFSIHSDLEEMDVIR